MRFRKSEFLAKIKFFYQARIWSPSIGYSNARVIGGTKVQFRIVDCSGLFWAFKMFEVFFSKHLLFSNYAKTKQKLLFFG